MLGDARRRWRRRPAARALVLTSDRDAFQLVSRAHDRSSPAGAAAACASSSASTPPACVERYGVRARPGARPDRAARRPLGQHPRAPRASAQKTAAELLRAHGDLEGVIAAAASSPPARRAAVDDAADGLRDFLRIATMYRDLPVERPPDHEPDWGAGAATLPRASGMARLAERLEERARSDDARRRSPSRCCSSRAPARPGAGPRRSASAPAARRPRSAPTSRCSRRAGRSATVDADGPATRRRWPRARRPVRGAVPRARPGARPGHRGHVPAALARRARATPPRSSTATAARR